MSEKPLTVTDNMVVTLAYNLYSDQDELLDSSEEYGPLEYIHGHGQILVGLEQAVSGMKVGEHKTILIPPDEGYGERLDIPLELVPRELFPDDYELEIGMEVELTELETEEELVAWITDIRDGDIYLDFNHPLAGETLLFEVEVLKIRPVTEEELAHGHVHDDDPQFFLDI